MYRGCLVDEAKEAAVEFIRQYAKTHQFFTGGDILAAFRASGVKGSSQDWRNKWGGLISSCANRGWFVKSGRVAPTSLQSHTTSLVQWHSRLYQGEQALVGVTAREQLEALRKDFVLKKMDLRVALWKAYELGLEAANADNCKTGGGSIG